MAETSRSFYLARNATISEGDPGGNYDHLSILRIGDGSATSSNRWFYLLDISGSPTYSGPWIPGVSKISDVIPEGSTITKVELILKPVAFNWSGKTSSVSNIRPLLSSWSRNTVTYNNCPNVGDVIASYTRRSTDNTNRKTYDISDSIDYFQDVLDNKEAIYGFRVGCVKVTPDSSKNITSYESEEIIVSLPESPKLVITYEEPEDPAEFRYSDIGVTDITSASAEFSYTIESLGGGELVTSGVRVRYSDIEEDPTDDDYDDFLFDHDDDPDEEPRTFSGIVIPANGYRTAWVTPFSTVTNSIIEKRGTRTRIDFRTLSSISGSGGTGYPSSISGPSITYGSGGAGAALPKIVGPGQVTMDGVTLSGPGPGGGAAGLNGSNAAANRGGGGGGGGLTGGNGGSGVVIVRYLTADGISSFFKTETGIFVPSLVFHNGTLVTPFNDVSMATIVNVTSSTFFSNGGYTRIQTTGAPEDYLDYRFIIMSGNADEGANGIFQIGLGSITPSGGEFDVDLGGEVPVTVGSKVVILRQAGVQMIGDLYASQAHLVSSRSALEMSTVEKSFMFITVIHEPFRDDESIELSWEIDGVQYTDTGRVKSDTEIVYDIYDKGFAIGLDLTLNASTDRKTSPVVRSMHIAWDFVKDNIHEYYLMCVKGADHGRWTFDPHDALTFIFDRSSDLLEFEDKYAGTYDGTIDEMELMQAGQSVDDGPSGILRVKVVEEG